MIRTVEYRQEETEGTPSVIITFAYDETDKRDNYVILGEDYPAAMNILQLSKDPECLMVNIRNLMRITVH